MSTPNKIALVTGAGSGIGRACALGLAAAGWHVALAGRRADALAETVAAAGKDGERLLPVPTDVGKPESVKALFAAIKQRFGRLDLLFNNAGMGTPAMPFEDIPYEQWSAVVAVNLTGPFLCAQEAFRIMKDQSPRGGRIINNGSISAYAPRPFSSPYTSTKHAVSGLTRATALDGRAYDIACGQVDVGNALTPMTERSSSGQLQPNGQTVPEPRMDVQNVADAIVFMATRPPDANALFLNIMATKMPFVGRG
jgi:NAD(P)-dependent dehydrogenase (short-subunit alcohol dehydrogenase family)